LRAQWATKKKSFGERLKKLRESYRFEKIGLSQPELAAKAGMTRQEVSQYESGMRKPTLQKARALAQALGVTVDELGEP
jgi:transcriptional regulator with XRE-family HTH domain